MWRHDDKPEPQKVTLGSYGAGRAEVVGLTNEDTELFLGSMAGAHWIRVVGGKLEHAPSYKDPPNPVTDTEMLPFWRHPTPGEKENAPTLFDFEKFEDHTSPSIYITSLCGYCYTPENYKMYAERLIQFGFECMRSRRGNDARFWEVWYLPGLWAAKEGLKEAIQSKDTKEGLDQALDFLAKNVAFGSLDVAVQRMCMPNPD